MPNVLVAVGIVVRVGGVASVYGGFDLGARFHRSCASYAGPSGCGVRTKPSPCSVGGGGRERHVDGLNLVKTLSSEIGEPGRAVSRLSYILH